MVSTQQEDGQVPANPIDSSDSLKRPPPDVATTESAHPPQQILPGDSATTKAEKFERHGNGRPNGDADEFENPATKRVKLEDMNSGNTTKDRRKGEAAIKPEFLIPRDEIKQNRDYPDDDAAEGADHRYHGNDRDDRSSGRGGRGGRGERGGKWKDKKDRGQNKGRDFGNSRDALPLCSSRATWDEFSARECRFGDKCKFEHDLRKYLRDGKREDLETFGGLCPIWEIKGTCPAGWKCRLAMSHAEEIEREDGRKELVLKEDEERKAKSAAQASGDEGEVGVVNIIPIDKKIALSRKKFDMPKSEAYLQWAKSLMDDERDDQDEGDGDSTSGRVNDNRAQYREPPFRPSEKRRIYYGPETPVLAPLTTQGNLPFRRLAVSLGAQITWSEMAMGLPLISGEKGEWALMKAHESELQSPKCNQMVEGYDNSKDIRFGAQIAANKPWIALKTTEVLTALCPHLRAIDLNCGCPIDLVCRQGGGSSLLDQHSKLEKMLRGMSQVSNEIPITVKIRMGTKDANPTAHKLVKRLVLGGHESTEHGQGATGVAAITLHGRSKQQRYTKRANWEYISDIAALIKGLKREQSERQDTVREVDDRNMPNSGNVYFCGNGDVYSHVEYQNHITQDNVDSIMIGRGALVKPWIFEEIENGQYLDKSASERLGYIEKFAKFGLEAWGSDEMGVGMTRRFLLEWLSFSCRYVPIGILEHLPPSLNERPPAYRGRDELETLLSSDNYRDWIKISEMFLGKAHDNFKFQPKHKSNSYENEVEG